MIHLGRGAISGGGVIYEGHVPRGHHRARHAASRRDGRRGGAAPPGRRADRRGHRRAGRGRAPPASPRRSTSRSTSRSSRSGRGTPRPRVPVIAGTGATPPRGDRASRGGEAAGADGLCTSRPTTTSRRRRACTATSRRSRGRAAADHPLQRAVAHRVRPVARDGRAARRGRSMVASRRRPATRPRAEVLARVGDRMTVLSGDDATPSRSRGGRARRDLGGVERRPGRHGADVGRGAARRLDRARAIHFKLLPSTTCCSSRPARRRSRRRSTDGPVDDELRLPLSPRRPPPSSSSART